MYLAVVSSSQYSWFT